MNGPAELYVGTGSGGALEFLGWSEAGMRFNFDAEFEDVMSDISGTRIPFDVQFMGIQAFMSGDLTVYNEPIFNKLLVRVPGGSVGTIGAGHIGHLLNLEGGGVRTLINAPYAAKAAFTATMQKAWNFPRAHLISPTEIDVGTRVKKIRFIFRAIPTWNQLTGEATLYDDSIVGKPGTN